MVYVNAYSDNLVEGPESFNIYINPSVSASPFIFIIDNDCKIMTVNSHSAYFRPLFAQI